ncbi:hypothetical protein [Sorangium sp. So ce117]|uniref:hypothetical protein n=1 Tax=Sorangium sp. So ce117 TaxID=3133277 RepID=UPI003F639167
MRRSGRILARIGAGGDAGPRCAGRWPSVADMLGVTFPPPLKPEQTARLRKAPPGDAGILDDVAALLAEDDALRIPERPNPTDGSATRTSGATRRSRVASRSRTVQDATKGATEEALVPTPRAARQRTAAPLG